MSLNPTTKLPRLPKANNRVIQTPQSKTQMRRVQTMQALKQIEPYACDLFAEKLVKVQYRQF